MFKKVLVSDDLGSINKGVMSLIDDLGINNVQLVQYCDDAYLRIKKSVLDKSPFDLFITDLSFVVDHREQRFASGEALINVLKQEYPDLKIIVYSVEDRLQRVRKLMQVHRVNAYVCKGRNGLDELKKAIKLVSQNENYLSPRIEQAISDKTDLEIDDFDIELMRLLSLGLSQDQISVSLRTNGIIPSSLSSIEKKINKLRTQFKANNSIHLVSIVKDMGLI